MNMQQIKNVYYYTSIMLIDNFIITTSPDYLTEKSLNFFGKLGKNEFIEYPKIKYSSQLSSILKNNDFWELYCRIWSVDKNNYELMNSINFLLNIAPIPIESKESETFKLFEKFLGDIDSTSTENLSYMVHDKILEYFDEYVDFNSRYFKLKILESIY